MIPGGRSDLRVFRHLYIFLMQQDAFLFDMAGVIIYFSVGKIKLSNTWNIIKNFNDFS